MRKYIAAAVIIGATVVLGYPVESAVVPAWSITVVDKDGYPMQGVEVQQYWRHFALEKTYSSQARTTNDDGDVHFPRRTIKASLLARLIRPVQMVFYYSMHRVQFEPVAHVEQARVRETGVVVVGIPYAHAGLRAPAQAVHRGDAVGRVQPQLVADGLVGGLALKPAGRAPHVAVGVDESGHHVPAAQVDLLGTVRDLHAAGRTHRLDAPVPHHHRRVLDRVAPEAVDEAHTGEGDHAVRGWRVGRSAAAERQDKEDGDDAVD